MKAVLHQLIAALETSPTVNQEHVRLARAELDKAAKAEKSPAPAAPKAAKAKAVKKPAETPKPAA